HDEDRRQGEERVGGERRTHARNVVVPPPGKSLLEDCPQTVRCHPVLPRASARASCVPVCHEVLLASLPFFSAIGLLRHQLLQALRLLSQPLRVLGSAVEYGCGLEWLEIAACRRTSGGACRCRCTAPRCRSRCRSRRIARPGTGTSWARTARSRIAASRRPRILRRLRTPRTGWCFRSRRGRSRSR